MTEIKFNVLIAEDEENIGNFISTILKTNGYKPIIATTGNQAIQCAESYCPDVILLDLGLPDMDGIDVISEIRKWAVTPIIVISARNRESEKVKALDAGADDYITKPFGNQELLARIRTALRHRRQPMGAETKTPMYHAGKVITYESIIKDIWGPHADTNNRILRVNMANIRRKIEKNPAVPKYVFTEVGVGYRMLENELNS